ncbi:Crp/Fnr family transcriptional regulator [Clostridium algidicarnis]|uniref:CRP-like cAMP-binding protein n=2 Tax=Clostridium algidicarnis TaxID=37659 RepID=A0A2S6FYX5_9CLOT|nr:Crp/Fnr family transcriptional regulator [Clostridium algidicarnis]MBB6630091.1 Crp/Fnr family transcriptional regulator [Clostridium algidicarnis]MBU3196935.1 Crp/Fnr family transcriptional regulator [Clostridium algidicarnis]MBU3218997.1 Crp/Fnr family transcriptional regulator [Clostridium algidicarnis]MCB2286315.1 Crp/Fnr family transcriptional regulator [Clostridium algidicarnis]PPK48817.1 CRP-like cAMP-binding protein [Clostridium algidicarnis DSM 15099]
MIKSDYKCLLVNLPLFENFNQNDLDLLLNSKDVKIASYSKDEIIFMEDDMCLNLSIILKGNVEIQKVDPSGKLLSVASLKTGDIFGENLLFGDRNIYPMTVATKSDSLVLHISKDVVAVLCQQNLEFLYSFLNLLSNKAMALSSKIKQVTLKTIRQKICEFLYSEYSHSNNKISLKMSKQEWAYNLGVQRPSLSRELIKLKEDGIIDYEKDYVLILNVQALKENI